MKNYLKLMRIKHWIKNLLVFLPIFFNQSFLKTSSLLTCILGFIIFSFAASVVYIINDINDVEQDKLHPLKKNRPLAAGLISIKGAKILIVFLIMAILLMSIAMYSITNIIFAFFIPIIYIVLNILYSKWLKHVPIIDVVILVFGFILRVIYGGIIIDVVVSKYLYLMIIFGSFYLGFGKRRNEIIKNGKKGRKVLGLYNKEFLDKNMYVVLSLAIVSYTLWCVDPSTIARIGNDNLFWTIPIIMVILQLYSLRIESDSFGDPIEVILSDKILLFTGMLYILVMIFLLYII